MLRALRDVNGMRRRVIELGLRQWITQLHPHRKDLIADGVIDQHDGQIFGYLPRENATHHRNVDVAEN
jgi:hypothetical protein